jgi:hypothetical protein
VTTVIYMYVDLPDGTTVRCPSVLDPVYGFPTTPGLDDPAWEVVE